MKALASEFLELIADGLKIKQRNEISRLLKAEKSDCFSPLNHYRTYPELQALSGRNFNGFREHRPADDICTEI